MLSHADLKQNNKDFDKKVHIISTNPILKDKNHLIKSVYENN